ncbi:TonB-dependent receptor [Bacterioplanoides sp. SCSIO 12839]|nr:TonB-dependent receptor [Bacterioplanoides sp. SCSIO 12839]
MAGLLSCCLACSTLAVAHTAVAADNRAAPALNLELAAGNLAVALNQLSRQAGVTLSYQQRQVQGFSVDSVSGLLSVEQALTTLLNGTGLHAVPVGEMAWLIEPHDQQDLKVLGAIQVQSRDSAVTDQVFREAASVSIITRDQIERFRGTSIGDIFQGTPGVLVSENRNSGGLDVNIRGMQGLGRVPVIVDGSRQETTVYRGYSGVSSRSYIDPDLVGKIRIDKGPVMSADGTGATGGVVSVNTLAAEDVVQPGELSGLRLRISGIGNNSAAPDPGTYAGYYVARSTYRSDCRFAVYCEDKYLMPERFAPEHGMDRPGLLEFGGYAASLAGAYRFDWGDLVAAYAQRDQGNYYAGAHGPSPEVTIGEATQRAWYKETPVSWDGASPIRAGERVPNSNLASQSLLLKSQLVLPSDQSLDLSYLRYDSQYGEMMPSQATGKGFGWTRQWLDSEVRNHTYTARYRYQPVDNDLIDVKWNTWHTDGVTELNTPGVFTVDLASNTHRIDDYQRWGTDLSNRMRFYPMGELRLDYGLAIQLEDMDTDTPQQQGGFYGGSRKGSREEYSAFVAAEWQPLPQWTLTAGIRHTRFHSKDDNAQQLDTLAPDCRPDGNGGCLPIKFENDDAGNAPVIALSWEPLAGLQFYLRRAEALRMPSLFEGTSGWSVSPALDVPLKGEHATNKEVGFNYLNHNVFDWQHQLRFKLAYFRNHVDDYLTRTHINAFEEKRHGDDRFRLRNIDSLDLHGWEMNIGYDAQSWLIELSGTRYRHIEICNLASDVRYYCTDWGLRDSYFNNMIPPNWHASLHLGSRWLSQKLDLGVRGTFMGERNSLPKHNADPGFLRPVPWHAYTLWDVYANYSFTDNIAMDFTVDNITDRYYLDALGLGLVPAPGRTARLSLTLQF